MRSKLVFKAFKLKKNQAILSSFIAISSYIAKSTDSAGPVSVYNDRVAERYR